LAEFKEKTKALLRSLDLTTNNSRSESLSWLDKYIIKVSVKNIGVAFPLAVAEELQVPRQSKAESSVRAFLFSIKSIAFDANRGESGEASMRGFSFQFVSRYATQLCSVKELNKRVSLDLGSPSLLTLLEIVM
jgi:hypothetical protein